MARSFDQLTQVVEAVNSCETVDDVVGTVARMLYDRHALMSVVVMRYDGDHAVVVALWMPMPAPALEPGEAVSLSLTPGVKQVSERVRSGHPVAAAIDEPDLGLLSDVSRAAGASSWVGVPLHDGKEVEAAMFLASTAKEGFTNEDLPFFSGVGRGVEDHVIRLVRSSER